MLFACSVLELHVSDGLSLYPVGWNWPRNPTGKKNWPPVRWYEICFLWKPSTELELAGMEPQPQASSHSHLPSLFLTVGEK